MSVRRLFHVSARYIRAPGRPGRRPRRGSGVQLAAAPPRLCHPFRAGRLGGNRRPDQRHKPFAPARARWDRDALRIRFMMYGELSFFHPFEHFSDTLQRLDFIFFDLVPTLSLPFYLAYIVLLFGADAALFLGAIYFLLLWISIFNMALAFVMFNRSIGLFGLGASLIFPLYQGVYLKCGRFLSYSSEIIFATSRHDDFVPPRVRRALLGDRREEPAQ